MYNCPPRVLLHRKLRLMLLVERIVKYKQQHSSSPLAALIAPSEQLIAFQFNMFDSLAKEISFREIRHGFSPCHVTMQWFQRCETRSVASSGATFLCRFRISRLAVTEPHKLGPLGFSELCANPMIEVHGAVDVGRAAQLLLFADLRTSHGE